MKPEDAGIKKPDGAGKGDRDRRNIDIWKRARYWYRSDCCNSKVTNTRYLLDGVTTAGFICHSCNNICEIRDEV